MPEQGMRSVDLCGKCAAVAARKPRETIRLCEIVRLVGYALGGLPGERLLDRQGIKCSDDTVLRRVKARCVLLRAQLAGQQPAPNHGDADSWKPDHHVRLSGAGAMEVRFLRPG